MDRDFTLLKNQVCEEKIYHNLIKVADELSCSLYLVGGILRDLFLNRNDKTPDMDFTSDHALKLAKSFSKLNRGTYVLLDGEEETARVIIKRKNKEDIMDFSQLRGNTIEEDISNRDFTINSIAISFRDLFNEKINVIDPSGGLGDLRDKAIKTVSPRAFIDDPLRIIRAFRFSAVLNFKISNETFSLMKDSLEKLKNVSAERIEAEIFKMLEMNSTSNQIDELFKLGILSIIIPEFKKISKKKWKENLAVYKLMEDLIDKDYKEIFPDFSGEFSNLFNNPFCKPMLKLSIVLYIISKTSYDCEKICKGLKMSNYKSETISKTVNYQNWLVTHSGEINKEKIQSKTIMDFFRKTGTSGPVILLAGFARLWKKENNKLLIEKINFILKIYFQKIKPMWEQPRILTGTDLVNIFNMEPGPVFKEILERLEEKQLDGIIQNKNDAIRFVSEFKDKYSG